MKPVPVLLLWLVLAPAALAQPLPDFTELVEAAAPAVVNISTVPAAGPTRVREPGADVPDDAPVPFNELFRRFFDEEGAVPGPFDGPSMGSGFLISPDGFVLTNYHVIRAGGEIVVTLSDRRQLVAELVGFDADSDLALLKVDGEDLPVVRLGDSSELEVGEWVVAIGSPFGFEHSVTAGIVSAKGRSLRSERYVPFLQTDVAINPGNSGGPLFNLAGEVVGINSQIYSRTGGFQGVSFAIPLEVALDVVAQLREHGRVSRGWLGVMVQDVSRELAESFDMQRPEGALVTQVISGSPAARAKLRTGDVILKFDGDTVERSSMLVQLVGGARANRTVKLQVLRDGRTHTLEVAVGELPRDEVVVPTAATPAPRVGGRLGAIVAELSAAQREAHDVPEHGVLVTEVGAGAAHRGGLRVGDVILTIDGARVRDPAHFAEIARGLHIGEAVPVLVQRGGSPIFLAFKVEADE